MPNRIIKESICTSENIEQLSLIAEIAFYRLMVNCDDYGRMDARPKILKARLFPLKNIDETDIITAMKALEKADLITMYIVDDKPYLQMNTWERHQQVRNHKSKYPSPDESDCNQLKSIEINCNQEQSNDCKCPRNPIQSESLSESLSVSESSALMDDDDARTIQQDHDKVITAAENAGFMMSNDVRAALIALYAEYGLQKMIDGFNACVNQGVPKLAYLKAVLKGEPKKNPPGRVTPAQNFEQRDYSNVDGDLMSELAREMAEFKARGSA